MAPRKAKKAARKRIRRTATKWTVWTRKNSNQDWDNLWPGTTFDFHDEATQAGEGSRQIKGWTYIVLPVGVDPNIKRQEGDPKCPNCGTKL